MAFPDAPRVLYDFNPLDEVICQLRFPPILLIDAEPPAKFQEQIRTDYPYYEQKASFRLPSGLPADFAKIVAAELPFGTHKAHEFGSKDRVWNLRLTREFLALTCHKYERWESFKKQLAGPIESLISNYAPPFFTRLGLRYRNVIRRSTLRLTEVGWSELLQPWIIGPLGSQETAQDVEFAQATCVLRLSDQAGQVQLMHGLAVDESNNEQVFLIDADFFFEQQTEPQDVFNRLDAFKREAHLLFHWCITDRLHKAMRPSPILPS